MEWFIMDQSALAQPAVWVCFLKVLFLVPQTLVLLTLVLRGSCFINIRECQNDLLVGHTFALLSSIFTNFTCPAVEIGKFYLLAYQISKIEGNVKYSMALPDIMSGPEVKKKYKIRTVQKPDVFLPGCQTFNTLK